MSYTVASPGAAKARPGPVFVAVILLYATAALILVALGLSLYSFFGLTLPVVTTTGADPQVAQVTETTTQVAGILSLVLYAALAAGFVTLAIQVGKGRNPARIVTWAIGGIVVLCCGCGLLGNVFSSAMLSNMQGVDQASIDALKAAQPGWLAIATAVVSGLIIVCLLTAVILLALPASNDFFRKEQEVWTPPTWNAGDYPPPPPPANPFPPAPPGPPAPPQQ